MTCRDGGRGVGERGEQVSLSDLSALRVGNPTIGAVLAVASAVLEIELDEPDSAPTINAVSERAGFHEKTTRSVLLWMLREGWAEREQVLLCHGQRVTMGHVYRLTDPIRKFFELTQ